MAIIQGEPENDKNLSGKTSSDDEIKQTSLSESAELCFLDADLPTFIRSLDSKGESSGQESDSSEELDLLPKCIVDEIMEGNDHPQYTFRESSNLEMKLRTLNSTQPLVLEKVDSGYRSSEGENSVDTESTSSDIIETLKGNFDFADACSDNLISDDKINAFLYLLDDKSITWNYIYNSTEIQETQISEFDNQSSEEENCKDAESASSKIIETLNDEDSGFTDAWSDNFVSGGKTGSFLYSLDDNLKNIWDCENENSRMLLDNCEGTPWNYKVYINAINDPDLKIHDSPLPGKSSKSLIDSFTDKSGIFDVADIEDVEVHPIILPNSFLDNMVAKICQIKNDRIYCSKDSMKTIVDKITETTKEAEPNVALETTWNDLVEFSQAVSPDASLESDLQEETCQSKECIGECTSQSNPESSEFLNLSLSLLHFYDGFSSAYQTGNISSPPSRSDVEKPFADAFKDRCSEWCDSNPQSHISARALHGLSNVSSKQKQSEIGNFSRAEMKAVSKETSLWLQEETNTYSIVSAKSSVCRLVHGKLYNTVFKKSESLYEIASGLVEKFLNSPLINVLSHEALSLSLDQKELMQYTDKAVSSAVTEIFVSQKAASFEKLNTEHEVYSETADSYDCDIWGDEGKDTYWTPLPPCSGELAGKLPYSNFGIRSSKFLSHHHLNMYDVTGNYFLKERFPEPKFRVDYRSHNRDAQKTSVIPTT